jgi:O-antigen ligase
VNTSRLNPRLPLRAGDIQLYRVCEDVTGGLLQLMVVFSPGAFGTTQPWAIWTMNVAGYVLGILLAVKLGLRWLTGYQPPRWDYANTDPAGLTRLLAGLTLGLLLYCLISALNAHATYHLDGLSFEYHDCVTWLPHTFDRTRTWDFFWMYLGLAAAFWAARDWLPGKGDAEELPVTTSTNAAGSGTVELLPARLRRLLWLLVINGGLLGLEGIVQRLEGSGTLLFIVKPHVNPTAISQFGPYAYRANAAQYFNLLWPVGLGFWWLLQRARGFRRHTHHWVLVSSVIMAACPIISASRGGAFITVGILLLGTLFLVASHFLFATTASETKRAGRAKVVMIVAFGLATLALGYTLGWKALRPRLAALDEGFAGREETYAIAEPMAADYPVFGTGPGTFATVFQLYRISTDTYWPVQLHNDWLETRITFGWVGSALIALALGTIFLRWFVRGGIHGSRRLVVMLWLALAGCLVHARYDFPFQIHSLIFLFLLLCAVLSNLSRRA